MFHTHSHFGLKEKADVIGFYGQNGSGKTAAVEAFNLLQVLLSAGHEASLPKLNANLLYFNEKAIGLKFRFIVENRFGEFFVDYNVALSEGRTKYQVIEEEVSYRENKENTSFESLISKNENGIMIRNKQIQEMSEAERISVMVANRMSVSNATSFVYREELKEAFENVLEAHETELVTNLSIDFNRDLHVIDTVQYGLLIANLVMPFSVHLEKKLQW